MHETVLLVGNGINNINNSTSWEALLSMLHKNYYDPSVSFDTVKQKPFPLVYEQIVLWQLKKGNTKIEGELKKLISADTCQLTPNSIHETIASGKWTHILTTNYEFNLVKNCPMHLVNGGCVRELLYSVFRHFVANDKSYWHLHGDKQNTSSINLGYEHYCGQLQKMREYTTGAYTASQKKLTKLFTGALVNRKYLQEDPIYSWIDFFFRDNTHIKILGFRLELEELDIWWLLTYRAKLMYGAKKGLRQPIGNKIQYYIPKQYTVDENGAAIAAYQTKKNLLMAMNIQVIELDIPHSANYYTAVLNHR